ncbi:hypothetical protein [Dielma fastidiosa]|uniref:Uncharacterized protein n=1 Tax=Dielma fastidiosa TaxID=1034346 RepID=A0A318KIN0_9FIRM|nr:hypothetical protein [Dielma fastidiosa]PXX75317.1 hypothetical protein DES51_11847 [Dielma fastidiosa]
MVKFVIKGRLAGLNEYTESNRSNPRKGNRVKHREQQIVTTAIRSAHLTPIHKPVVVYIDWFEKDNRRDVDNITAAKKFIMDSLVDTGILKDDSRRYVKQIVDCVFTDTKNPRIEVELVEVG